MIPVKTIETKADQIIAGTPTAAQLAQLVAVGDYIDDVQVLTAATVATLPSAANNKGIIYYVTATQKYYFSDGTNWRSDFTSDYEVQSVPTYAWGLNSYGQLGNGTSGSLFSRLSPVTAQGGTIVWSQVSAGSQHGLGVSSTGIAYGWGRNNYGQLGDNTTSNRSSPVTVVGGITNWSRVSAGAAHNLGVTTSGIAYAWGRGGNGRLGDNTTSNRSSPVTVVGGITTWSQVTAGSSHSLGLTSTGIAYAWGLNSYGRLGDNTQTSRLSPVTVVGGITNWNQITAGADHTLGLTSTGIAYAWGRPSFGKLGDNTNSPRSSPAIVAGGITSWKQLSAGGNHSLGVTSTGTAYSWGHNYDGQLGDGTPQVASKLSPVVVIGGITNWSQLSAGENHSLGLTSAGIAYGWGGNSSGAIGDNTTTRKSSPVTVVGGITTWSQVSAGGGQSLAINLVAQYTKGFV